MKIKYVLPAAFLTFINDNSAKIIDNFIDL